LCQRLRSLVALILRGGIKRTQDGGGQANFMEHVPLQFETAPADPYPLVLPSPVLSAGAYTLALDLLDAFPGHGTSHDVLLAQRTLSVQVLEADAPDRVQITAVGIAAQELPLASAPDEAHPPAATARGCTQMTAGLHTSMVVRLSRAPAAGSQMQYLWSLPASGSVLFERTSSVSDAAGAGLTGTPYVEAFDVPALASGQYLLRVYLLGPDQVQTRSERADARGSLCVCMCACVHVCMCVCVCVCARACVRACV